MSNAYQTEHWQAQIPDAWSAREADGQARVEIRKVGGVGVLEVITTDNEPSAWDRKGEAFHGQLYGKKGEYQWEEFNLVLTLVDALVRRCDALRWLSLRSIGL